MKGLLENRSFIKDEIMFYFYGSVMIKAVDRAVVAGEVSQGQATVVVKHIRSYLDKKFYLAFRLKSILAKAVKLLAKSESGDRFLT